MRTLSEGPTTADEFAQSLIEDGLDHWLLDTAPEAAEVPDTVAEPAEQPRDEHGRFMSKSVSDDGMEDSEEEEVPADAGIEPEAESDDVPEDGEAAQVEDLEFELEPEVLAVLDKYDGDLNKALKALTESQSFIGRQANELGELREAQRQMLEALQQIQQPQFPAWMPYQNDIEENPAAVVQEVLERTAQTGQFDEATYERAISLWGDEDPFGAARMDARVSFIRQMVAQADGQVHEEDQASPMAEPSVEEAMKGVVQRHPDVEKYLPAIGEAAKEFPTLREAMANGTATQKAQAFEELLVISKNRQLADTSKEAMKRVVLKAQEEVRKEKSDAAVISAGRRTAATATPSGLDAFYEAFDRATGQSEED